ncbi:MAG: hypothetical protein KC619_18135 [Myxococcales bacterium]|nr:hypothetical protein [Myxococcales bacterium]
MVAKDMEPEPASFEEERTESVHVEAREASPPEIQPQRVARPIHRRGQPAVDIDLIHERRTAPLPDHDWTFVEIWTRNTIYALDSRLVCIAVIDQNTRRIHADHALLGARLVGGQLRDGESMELSHPFPRPGSEAVFEQSKGRQVRFSQTSSVTRVVLRLRVLTVSSDNLLPTWEEITGRHDLPGVGVKKPSES